MARSKSTVAIMPTELRVQIEAEEAERAAKVPELSKALALSPHASTVSFEMTAAAKGKADGERMIEVLAAQEGEFSNSISADQLQRPMMVALEMAANGRGDEARALVQALCRAVGPYLEAGSRMLWPHRHQFLSDLYPPLEQVAPARRQPISADVIPLRRKA